MTFVTLGLTGGIEDGAASARFSLCRPLAACNYQQRSMTEMVTLARAISSAAAAAAMNIHEAVCPQLGCIRPLEREGETDNDGRW